MAAKEEYVKKLMADVCFDTPHRNKHTTGGKSVSHKLLLFQVLYMLGIDGMHPHDDPTQ